MLSDNYAFLQSDKAIKKSMKKIPFTPCFYLFFYICFSLCSCSGNVNFIEPRSLPSKYIKPALVYTPSPSYIVKTKSNYLIEIKSIDNKLPTFLESKAVVAPGIHNFQVHIQFREASKLIKDESVLTQVDTNISFPVEANKEYLINTEKKEQQVFIWAEDVDTAVVVGGEKP